MPKINHEDDPHFPPSLLTVYSPLQIIPALLVNETGSDGAMAAALAYAINNPGEVSTEDVDKVISELLLSMPRKTSVNISRFLSGIVLNYLIYYTFFGR